VWWVWQHLSWQERGDNFLSKLNYLKLQLPSALCSTALSFACFPSLENFCDRACSDLVSCFKRSSHWRELDWIDFDSWQELLNLNGSELAMERLPRSCSQSGDQDHQFQEFHLLRYIVGRCWGYILCTDRESNTFLLDRQWRTYSLRYKE
jgi:hypothetical protein